MSLALSASVVIPVFNSQDTLPELIDRLSRILPGAAEEFEVILVNDGSSDTSWDVICHLVEANAWVGGLNLMRNYGQHNALLAGIRAAGGEIIVTMDDDLQHPPEEIPKLLEKVAAGYDVVYGTPQRKQHGLLRKVAAQAVRLVYWGATGDKIFLATSAFRAFRTQVRESFTKFQGPFVSIDVLLTWGTTRFAVVPVRHEPRQRGASNYTFGKLVIHALNIMMALTTLPLQLASWLGFAFVLFGTGVLIYGVGRMMVTGSSVSGFPFLALFIAIIAGAQLLALGIIGQYVGRIHTHSMGQPSSVIRESVGILHEDGKNKT